MSHNISRIWFQPTSGGYFETRDAEPDWVRKLGFGERLLINYGRCRSGQRWFWSAVVCFRAEQKKRYGWEDSEAVAEAAARAAVIELAGDGYALAVQRHGWASAELREINKAKRAARPAPDTADARATEYLFAEHYYDPEMGGPRVWSIRAFPIVRKTAKRIYYKQKWLEWIPEIDAPDISRQDSQSDDQDIRFADREELERTGETEKYGGSWGSVLRDDYRLYLKPPLRHEPEPDLPDLAELKAEMAAAHPDRGGSNAAFIEARKRYVEARRRQRAVQ